MDLSCSTSAPPWPPETWWELEDAQHPFLHGCSSHRDRDQHKTPPMETTPTWPHTSPSIHGAPGKGRSWIWMDKGKSSVLAAPPAARLIPSRGNQAEEMVMSCGFSEDLIAKYPGRGRRHGNVSLLLLLLLLLLLFLLEHGSNSINRSRGHRKTQEQGLKLPGGLRAGTTQLIAVYFYGHI